MLKHKRENRLIHCLVCWKCGGRTGPNHYTLEGGGATCSLCGDRNPLGNLRRMPLDAIKATHEIVLCFGPSPRVDGAVSVMALHLDCKTALSPYRDVASDETLVRLIRYLGATQEQVAQYETDRRRWGQGSVHVTLLPRRKNLLQLDWSKL
jgi:hypothetical protein